MNRNGFGLIGLLIALGIVAVLGGGTFYGYQGGFFDGTASSTITAPIDAANKAKELLEKNNQEIATDWKTYRNEEYNFQLKYPSDWIRSQHNEEIFLVNLPESVNFYFSIVAVPPMKYEDFFTIEEKRLQELNSYIKTEPGIGGMVIHELRKTITAGQKTTTRLGDELGFIGPIINFPEKGLKIELNHECEGEVKNIDKKILDSILNTLTFD